MAARAGSAGRWGKEGKRGRWLEVGRWGDFPALSYRSTRTLSLVLAGRLTSSGNQLLNRQTAQRPRAPAPRVSRTAFRADSSPAAGPRGRRARRHAHVLGARRPVRGAPPAGPRTPAVTAAAAGWGGAPAGTLSSSLIPLVRNPRAAGVPPEARQESRRPGPGQGQAQRPAGRGTAGAQGPAPPRQVLRGRKAGGRRPGECRQCGASPRRSPRPVPVSVPAPHLAAARAGRRGRFLLATSWGGARRPRRPRCPFHFAAARGAPGPGRRRRAAGGSALPLRLITPSAILSVLPRSSPGPWARRGSQTAPGAPPREWRPAAGAPRPPPAPARHFGGRLVSLHLPAGSAGAYWLVLHWPTGSSPWALSPQGRSYQHATKRRAPLEGPALKRVFLGLLAFIPTAPSQESES